MPDLLNEIWLQNQISCRMESAAEHDKNEVWLWNINVK